MSYFICPNTASGSIGRLDRCSSPFSEVSLSLALLPVLHQSVVDLNLPVALPFLVASPPERTSLAVPCPVDCIQRPVSSFRPVMSGTDSFHMLAHRADIVVLIAVVVEVFNAEDAILEGLLLLLMEEVVLDECLRVTGFHERVVLLAAIAGVSTAFLRHVPIPVGER